MRKSRIISSHATFSLTWGRLPKTWLNSLWSGHNSPKTQEYPASAYSLKAPTIESIGLHELWCGYPGTWVSAENYVNSCIRLDQSWVEEQATNLPGYNWSTNVDSGQENDSLWKDTLPGCSVFLCQTFSSTRIMKHSLHVFSVQFCVPTVRACHMNTKKELCAESTNFGR